MFYKIFKNIFCCITCEMSLFEYHHNKTIRRRCLLLKAAIYEIQQYFILFALSDLRQCILIQISNKLNLLRDKQFLPIYQKKLFKNCC